MKATFDTVVNSRKKLEIQAEAKRLAGGSEDSKKWLPHYQTAKKNVKDELSDEERESIEDEVEEWKTKGIPRAVQAEYVVGSRGTAAQTNYNKERPLNMEGRSLNRWTG